MNGIRASGGERLCGGGRHAGEMYLESGQCQGGRPIEDFLVDLPLTIDPVEWNISPIGISTFVDEHGITNVLDWVGETHYPEVADFIEEARRLGVSRRVSHTGPIEHLSAQSRLFLLHPRAAILNAAAFLTPPAFRCPCQQGHTTQQGCLGLAWHASENAGPGRRQLARGETYAVRPPLAGKPEYGLAVFMTVPITALTVIAHPETDIQNARETRVRQSGLPVFVDHE